MVDAERFIESMKLWGYSQSNTKDLNARKLYSKFLFFLTIFKSVVNSGSNSQTILVVGICSMVNLYHHFVDLVGSGVGVVGSVHSGGSVKSGISRLSTKLDQP